VDITAPVPIDVWSSITLEYPTAGRVAVPTTSRVVGGTYTGFPGVP
jgi:hypothetical protein